jgi:hypothetical protein
VYHIKWYAFTEQIEAMHERRRLARIVIDEAHCCSQVGRLPITFWLVSMDDAAHLSLY